MTDGQPGSLSLSTDDKMNILAARHLASEVFRRYLDPKKGLVEEWDKSGQNHLLDCCGMGWVGLRYLGWDVPNNPILGPEKEKPKDAKKPEKANWISRRLAKNA